MANDNRLIMANDNSSEAALLTAIRARIIDRTARAIAVLGIPAVALSIARTTLIGWQNVFFVQIFVIVLAWMVVILQRRLPYRVKALLIIGYLFTASFAGLWRFGLLSYEVLISSLACILAAIFLGMRTGIAALILACTVSLSVGLLKAQELHRWFNISSYIVHPIPWYISVVALIFMTGVTVILLGTMQDALYGVIGSLAERQRENEQINRALISNISELENANDEIRQSEQRLRLHFEQTSLGVIEWDTEFRVTHWNSAAERIFGYTKEEAIGQHGSFIVPDFNRSALSQVWLELLDRMGGARNTNENITKDGKTILCEWFNTPLTTADDKVIGVASVVDDITEHARADEEKHQFYNETISSVIQGKLQMSSVDEIAVYQNISDFRTSIHNYMDTTITRQGINNYFLEYGFTGDEFSLFLLAAGEAMTNAIKHAGSGEVFAGSRGKYIWVVVSDNGPGIPAINLPKATLQKGYSTRISMGMGYSVMLDVCDLVMLNTGAGGTMVVLKKKMGDAKPSFSLEDMPDIWDDIPST